jgi:cold shock protein
VWGGRRTFAATPRFLEITERSQLQLFGERISPPTAAAQGNPEVLRDTVRCFNQMKGYGFIAPDEGGPDVFVHVTAVERSGLPTLPGGQVLEYQTHLHRNGKSAAVNLRLA